jgi:predicted DNA-binding protein (UPF0251 family)
VQRRLKESRVPSRLYCEPADEDEWKELQPLLDKELSKLPDRYREAIVLCDLMGKSRKEAAQQLDIPEGTLSSRLVTARRTLADRIKRLGIMVSGGALALTVSQNAASASVPAPLVACTVEAASAVATGAAAARRTVSRRRPWHSLTTTHQPALPSMGRGRRLYWRSSSRTPAGVSPPARIFLRGQLTGPLAGDQLGHCGLASA